MRESYIKSSSLSISYQGLSLFSIKLIIIVYVILYYV